MLVKMKTAWVTWPLEVARGAARFAIGAKNARKMCDIESIKKTRSIGLLLAGAFKAGICSMIERRFEGVKQAYFERFSRVKDLVARHRESPITIGTFDACFLRFNEQANYWERGRPARSECEARKRSFAIE